MQNQQRIQEIAEHFGNGASPISIGWILVGGGLVLFIIAAMSLRHWWRSRHERESPVLTFVAFARPMGLTWAQMLLLYRIAKHQKLPSPLTLMLSSQTLRHHSEACARALSPSRRGKLLHRTDAIAQRLFESQGALLSES